MSNSNYTSPGNPQGPAVPGGIDELYRLAMEQGIVPAPPENVYQAPEQYPDTMQGGLTPPDMSPAELPGGSGMPGAESFGVKIGQGGGSSSSVSSRGVNPTTLGMLDKRDDRLGKSIAASDAQVKERMGPAVDVQNEARASGQAAVDAQVMADQKKAELDSQGAQLLQGINADWAQSEERIFRDEAARKNQRISDYMASLQDFAASKVNPNQLWDGLSGGMRFGTMVTAFVHDFLGAKGIKTSAMQTLNTAIDRNIAAQIANINNKKDVAAGFKQLYDLEVSRSGSAAEARARIKGYMLEATRQHVTATMGAYNALLATANGRKGMAQIDKAYADNMAEIVKFEETSSRARQGQLIEHENNKTRNSISAMQAATAQRSQRIDELRYNDAQKAAAVKAQLERKDNIIIDPETNTGKLIMKGQRSPAEQSAVRNAVTETANYNRAMKELRELSRRTDTNVIDELGVTRFSSEAKRKYDSIRYNLAHAAVKANNERATKEDVEQYLKGMPIDTKATEGGVSEILSYTHGTAIDRAQDLIQQHAWDLPEDQWIKGSTGKIFEGSRAEAKATEEQGKRGGYQKTQVETAVESISAPDSHKAPSPDQLKKMGWEKPDVDANWKAAVDANPKLGSKEWQFGDAEAKVKSGSAPGWAAGVMALGDAARKSGDADAKAKLTRWATGDIISQSAKDPDLKNMSTDNLYKLRAFAQYELSKMPRAKQEPGELTEQQFGPTPESEDPTQIYSIGRRR